jgi:hypothetical protein
VNIYLKPVGMRATTNPQREPLKSGAEIAEMLGISTQAMASSMQHHPAPKAELALNATTHRNRVRYYRPSLMRKWWAEVQSARVKAEAVAV